MALPQFPGLSFIAMYTLIENWRFPLHRDVFTTELLLAICWEESFFNNIKQSGKGTAVGFGQTEPRKFKKLESQTAYQRGYFVKDLPGRTGSKLDGELTQFQSVQVQSAMLCQLYMDLKKSDKAALEAYAGVPWSRTLAQEVKDGKKKQSEVDAIDPLKVAGRLEKIAGWHACAKILRNQLPPADPRAKIKEALNASRKFKSRDAEFHPILFPEGDEFWKEDFKYCFGRWVV